MNRKKLSGLIILIVAIGLVVSLVWWKNAEGTSTGYQAVFLTNNQVYFGKISHRNGNYVTLSDIFYIQVGQPLQSQTPEKSPQANLNLVKLGNELHGPTDTMEINREHILFIENLKSDSQVAKAIQNYKSTNH